MNKTNSVKTFRGLGQRYYFVMWRVVLITLATMGVLGALGNYIDSLRGLGKHHFAVAGLLIAYPLTQAIIYFVFRKIQNPTHGTRS